jgi:hypothetical protein
VVGNRIVTPPAGDRHRRMLLTAIVACRNLGLR